IRQVAFAGYLVVGGLFLAFTVVRPLLRRINPYYAAKQVEETLPEAKNSLVNWLDLQDETLPLAIRAAVGQRAAKDLAQADVDRAISGRRAGWLGGATTALLIAFLVLLIAFGPRQFFSILGRNFAPFLGGPIAHRTKIMVVQPAGGNAVVPIGKAVTIAVQVEGRVPDP